MVDTVSSDRHATKTRILDAARCLLEERPGTSPSMGEVAKRAGVSRQALYLHLRDRTQLFVELSRAVDAAERTPAEQRRVDEAPTGRRALAEAIALQARLKPKLHGIATALDALRRGDPAAQTAWQEREHARLSRCEDVIQRLNAEGVLAQPWSAEAAARLMWAVTSQRVWEDLVLVQGCSTEQYVADLTGLLEHALLS